MSAPDFLDTNVLVYAYDDEEPLKQGIGRDYMRRAMKGEFMVSVQVLMELATTLLHKFSTPVSHEQMTIILDALDPVQVVRPDRNMVRRAVEARAQYGLHFYDGMIVAAAERAGCKKVWSEDLNAGQSYFGVAVENPFA